MTHETYVYDGVEVKKTGRTAERKTATIPGRSTDHVLHEITPVDPDLDWKKWVDAKALYKVIDMKDNSHK